MLYLLSVAWVVQRVLQKKRAKFQADGGKMQLFKILASVFLLLIFVSACSNEPRFDGSNEEAVGRSIKEILKVLPEDEHEEFQKAIMYFGLGGAGGREVTFGTILFGNTEETRDTIFSVNMQKIDGLTGSEILKRYREQREQDRLKEEQREAEREQLEKLQGEANALLRSNDFEQALARYEAMGKLASGVELAEEGVAETTEAMKVFAEKSAYIDKIEITEFTAKRIDTYRENGVPAVRLGLKNNGDRSLDQVEVIVYFQDESGATIYEESFNPVYVSQFSYGRDNKPLKAGYVYEMEKDRYMTLDTPLSQWADGKAEIKIVNIKFSD